MSVIGREYDGKLTFWVRFDALNDKPNSVDDTALVAEVEYIALHEQLQGAVDDLREAAVLLAEAAFPDAPTMARSARALADKWGQL